MDNKNTKVINATREYYDETLRMLSVAFQYDDPYWFVKNYGHVCPSPETATDTDISNHIITLVDNKVVGAVGVYPFEFIISYGDLTQTIKIGGIGQVSCLKEYRGQGIMSKMLHYAIAHMQKNGYHGSFLHGDRMRYKHFGWDFAGNNLKFSFSIKDLNAIALGEQNEYQIKTATEADIFEINALYELFPSRTLRDHATWQRRLQTPNNIWNIITCKNSNKKAYVCFSKPKQHVFVEVSGDANCIIHGIRNIVAQQNLNKIDIYYPACEDNTASYLLANSTEYIVENSFHLNLFNTDELFTELEKFIYKQGDEYNINKEQIKKEIASLDASMKETICRKLLGYTYFPLPSNLKFFHFISELIFWLPNGDDV